MAIAAHLVYRDAGSRTPAIDGVRNVILAINDGVDTTDALVRARAVTVLNAAGFDLPTGYFTANRLMSVYDAAGDVTVIGKDGENLYEAIA